jgi:hypothetical protein
LREPFDDVFERPLTALFLRGAPPPRPDDRRCPPPFDIV